MQSAADESPDKPAVILRGADFPALTEIELVEAGPGVALALTAGGRPKAYHHTDPNEDVVAVATGSRATVLVCADGHNGAEGSTTAVDFVLQKLGEDPPPADLDDVQIVDLFWKAGVAVLNRGAASDAVNPDSRTTLIVALLAGRRLQWGALGDSSLLVGSQRGVRDLSPGSHTFVGWPMAPNEVADEMTMGVLDLGDSEWVVLATDGLSEFSGGRVEAVTAAVLAESTSALSAAAALVEAANDGGAGDNVGIVVVAPPGPTGSNL